MKRVPVTAKLLSPVAIKSNRQSERSDSVRSIAGTQVRGALAQLYMQRHGQADETFKSLFLNESACRYGPLDPGPDHFPLTAASCKREGIRHVLRDRLWYRIAQHYMEGRALGDAEEPWRRCGICKPGNDLKEQEGFFWPEQAGVREADTAQRQVAAHVGIDRRTATAAEAIFYTLEAMMPSGQDADLHGWFMMDENALVDLARLLQDEDHCISVGHHRTRGYGDVQLQMGEGHDWPQSQENWLSWSEDLVQFLRNPAFAIPDLHAEEDFFFSLSFPAGALWTDRFLRYTLDPAAMIPWLPAMSSPDQAFPLVQRPVQPQAAGGAIRWIAAVTRHERLRGWNAAHGLPRQDEWMVARGSVYAYHFQGTGEQRDALLRQLTALLRNGTGLRRNEGFGRVSVSHDFHRRFHQ